MMPLHATHPHLCRAQLSLLQARAAAEAAAAERQAILQQSQAAARSSRAGADRPQGKSGPAQRGSGGSSSSTPAWKQFKRNKGLGRQAEATLEMIYARTEVRTGRVGAGRLPSGGARRGFVRGAGVLTPCVKMLTPAPACSGPATTRFPACGTCTACRVKRCDVVLCGCCCLPIVNCV